MAGKGAVFVPNPLGILEASRSVEMLLALKVVAEEIAIVARSIAPVDADDEEWGHYRDRIVVPEPEIFGGLGKAAVLATKPTSGWIEFGTGGGARTPRFAVLRRAAESVAGPVTGGKGAEGEMME